MPNVIQETMPVKVERESCIISLKKQNLRIRKEKKDRIVLLLMQPSIEIILIKIFYSNIKILYIFNLCHLKLGYLLFIKKKKN